MKPSTSRSTSARFWSCCWISWQWHQEIIDTQHQEVRARSGKLESGPWGCKAYKVKGCWNDTDWNEPNKFNGRSERLESRNDPSGIKWLSKLPKRLWHGLLWLCSCFRVRCLSQSWEVEKKPAVWCFLWESAIESSFCLDLCCSLHLSASLLQGWVGSKQLDFLLYQVPSLSPPHVAADQSDHSLKLSNKHEVSRPVAFHVMPINMIFEHRINVSSVFPPT